MLIISQSGPMGPFAAEIDRLERLVADLKLVLRTGGPSAKTLEDAPVIHQQRLVGGEVPCLRGLIVGHPRCPTGPAVTSELVIIAPHGRWARTASRFYRLGQAVVLHEGLVVKRWQ